MTTAIAIPTVADHAADGHRHERIQSSGRSDHVSEATIETYGIRALTHTLLLTAKRPPKILARCSCGVTFGTFESRQPARERHGQHLIAELGGER